MSLYVSQSEASQLFRTRSGRPEGEGERARADHEAPREHGLLHAHELRRQDGEQHDVTSVHQPGHHHVHHDT